MSRAMQEVQRVIRDATSEFDTEEYITFMQALSEWASSQADIMEWRSETDPDNR